MFSNFAMTADGKIAFAGGGFAPFSSARDHEHMMELRATADAILCGARTVEVTKTVLGNGGRKFQEQRLKNGLAEFPLRVIASGSGALDPKMKLFQKHFSPIVILTTHRITGTKLKILRAVADEVSIFGGHEIDFRAAFLWLRKKWNVKRLLCEGGGELHGALIRAGLVDELHLTICPKIFGGRAAPTIADGMGFRYLADAKRFRLKSYHNFDGELFTVLTRL
ncbi:MAG TPA: RibD family protein [Verrucomicrobiae bacterium]|nr:RibD family protein [Verrucomicrobiae bacterium]